MGYGFERMDGRMTRSFSWGSMVWHLHQAQHDERNDAQTDSQDDGHVAGFRSGVVGHVRFGCATCDRLERGWFRGELPVARPSGIRLGLSRTCSDQEG